MRFPVVVGGLGGAVDVLSGVAVLWDSMTPSSMGAAWFGWSLIALGAAVLASTLIMALSPRSSHRTDYGGLMLAFGIGMLPLGAAMIASLVPMMSGSLLSGTAMVVVGIGMLYSGAAMTRM